MIQPRERLVFKDQFEALKPNNGVVTGEQAKGFLLRSQLPPSILGQIWYNFYFRVLFILNEN